MNKVLASLLMIGMVAAMAGAGTFAWYTDEEKSVGNAFTAGTLDLVFDGQNGVKTGVEFTNIQPSYNDTWELNLTNIGTCNGSLSLWIVNLKDDDNGCTEPEDLVDDTCELIGGGELSKNLYIVIKDDQDNTLYDDSLYNLSVKHYDMESQIDLGDIDGESTRLYTMGYYVPSDVNNIIQSDSSTFDIVVDLLQIEMPHP